jgi:hypothetical protein
LSVIYLFVICLVIICLLVCYARMTIWCKPGALFVDFLWPVEPENRDRLFGDCRSHHPHRLKHPPAWSAAEQQACFVVRGQPIGDAQRFAAASNRFARRATSPGALSAKSGQLSRQQVKRQLNEPKRARA